MQQRGLSQRRACSLLALARSTARYQPRFPKAESELVERIRTLASKHPRLGYRRVGALLRRQGQPVNPKRVYRLWRREGLAVPKRAPKKRGKRPKQKRPLSATQPDQVWTVDFLQDQTTSGQKLRLLTVTDEFTRESLAIEVGRSLTAKRVVETLTEVIAERGRAPEYLRSDNRPEFVAQALRGFLRGRGVTTSYIEPGSPWQNGFAESFPSRFRDEFLNREVFVSTVETAVRTRVWRRWYNEERPHSSLGYQTPSEFATRWRVEQGKRRGLTSILVHRPGADHWCGRRDLNPHGLPHTPLKRARLPDSRERGLFRRPHSPLPNGQGIGQPRPDRRGRPGLQGNGR
jgi:putative transposase